MSTALVKLDPALLKKARMLAGSYTKGTKVSYVKINYTDENIKAGNFIFKAFNKDTEQYTDFDLGATFKAVVLTHTKKAGLWDQDAQKNLYESVEFDTYQERVDLNDADGNFVESGTYKELKTKYDLKLQIVLYLYIEGRGLAKLFVKGMPIVGFGDYEQSLNEMGGALQAFETVFSTTKEKNGAVTYYSLKFNQGDYTDFPKMVDLSEECRRGIALMNNKRPEKDEVLPDVQVRTPDTGEDDLPFS